MSNQDVQNLIVKAQEFLEQKAKEKQLVYFGDVYSAIGLDCTDLSQQDKGSYILTEINKSAKEKGFMLIAIVVDKSKMSPYPGFYKLAQEGGLLSPYAKEDKKMFFWAEEVGKVFDFYKLKI